MAGAAGLEPVTSAVTGQRSNQLSYAPAMGTLKIINVPAGVKLWFGDLKIENPGGRRQGGGGGEPR